MTRAAVALVAAVLVMHASGAFADVGDVTTFTDPAGNVDLPDGITTGPDGALWFTSSNNKRIGRITTAGAITTFTDPADTVDHPFDIAAGPDGNLWFTSSSNERIGRITTAGAITTFTDPADTVDHPFDIAVVHEQQQRRHRTHRDHRPATCPARSACRRGSALHGLSSYTATVPQSPPP